MNTCRNTDHPHCTFWVAPGQHACEGGHGQPSAGREPASETVTSEIVAAAGVPANAGAGSGTDGSAGDSAASSYALLAAVRNARTPHAVVQDVRKDGDNGTRTGMERPVGAGGYARPIRVRPQLHISGFDPRAAGGRQTLKMELRGMPDGCAPQLAIRLSSELIGQGATDQRFVRCVDGDWRPVFVEFSSRDREHGQYQIHTEVLSRQPGQPVRKWECTFVILVPRLDATLTEIHRIFLSTHKNVRVMADDASIARVSDHGGHGGGSMDIDVTARNAGIAHLDVGAPQGKVDLGFSTIAWDEDLIEIDMPHTGPAHPHPSRAATFVNAAPEAGAQRHIRLFAHGECVFGRMEIVDPEADVLLNHYGPDGIDAAGLTRRLSGRHAVVRRGSHGFEIEDVSRYGLLLDGVWPGKHKPVPLRLGMRIELSASIKGIVVLEVTALMPHGVILHRIDEGACAECFVVLAPDTHPGYPIRRTQAAPVAAALPLLFHHDGGFWHLDAVTGKETALGPHAQLDKLSRMPSHTRFAADPYPESYVIRAGGVAMRTVAGEMHTA